MSARDAVLARIRSALADRPIAAQMVSAYRRAGELPVSVDGFIDRLEDYRASVHRVEEAGLPKVLARLLHGDVAVPSGVPEPWLTELSGVLRDEPPLDPRQLDGIPSVLTTCAVAIAETGTIVLDGGPGQGRRLLSLIPDHHVLVVRTGQVVANVPDALPRLEPTRPLTWISGPSATSDIELDRVEGVHGPRKLDVVLLT